jgi:hypothetical protein
MIHIVMSGILKARMEPRQGLPWFSCRSCYYAALMARDLGIVVTHQRSLARETGVQFTSLTFNRAS